MVQENRAGRRSRRSRPLSRLAIAGILAGGMVALSGRAEAPLEISVSVPGPGNTVSLPVELIGGIGADREEGARVLPRFVGGGGLALNDLMSRNADFAVLGLPAAMLLHTRDRRVIALAAIDDLPLYVLSVRADLRDKVTTVADLRGHVIGVHSDSLTTKTTSHQLAELILLSHRVPLDSVRFVAAGQSWETQLAALKSGSVDAVLGDEPFATRLEALGVSFMLFSTGRAGDIRNIPGAGFLRATLIGRSDLLEEEPRKTDAMVRIVKRVLEWIASHTPEEVADRLSPASAEGRKDMIELLRRHPRQYSRDGRFSNRQLRETEIFFRASNPDNPAAQRLSLDEMIRDEWVGRKD